jgi:Calcineurin-like phosphoesterase
MLNHFVPLGKYRGLLLGLLLCLLLSILAPGTRGDEPLPASNWNPTNLARIKASPERTLTFAVMGDNSGTPPVFQRLLSEVQADPDITFVIHLGDMVKQGELEEYSCFFKEVQEGLQKPLLTVVGNHELAKPNGRKLYRDIFGPDYYTFQLNGHCFVMMDVAENQGPGEGQLRWLEEELQKAQNCLTRLVFFHIPLIDPRGGSYHHALSEEAGRRLGGLFKKYKVTHIFAAHMHSYFTGDWSGIPYTITAGAGAPLYETDPQHYFFHYLKVSLLGDKVQIQVQRLASPKADRRQVPRPRVWLSGNECSPMELVFAFQ